MKVGKDSIINTQDYYSLCCRLNDMYHTALYIFQAEAVILGQRPRRRDNHGFHNTGDEKIRTPQKERPPEEMGQMWLCNWLIESSKLGKAGGGFSVCPLNMESISWWQLVISSFLQYHPFLSKLTVKGLTFP